MTLPSTSYKLVFTSDTQWHGSFSAAVAAAESSFGSGTLVVDSACVLIQTQTITCPVIFAGGMITFGDYSLVFTRLTSAPLDQQIFALTGSGTLTINNLLTPLSPEMFGGGTAANDAANLNAFNQIAAVARNSATGVTIVMGTGTYLMSDTPDFDDTPGIFIKGSGTGSTIVQRSEGGSSNPLFWFRTSSAASARVNNGGVEGCTLDGNGVAAYCLRHTSCASLIYSNLGLKNATTFAWYWDCTEPDQKGSDWNNENVLAQVISIDQTGTPNGGGIYLDGSPDLVNNTGPCTFVQLHIRVSGGDAFTLANCGNNAVLECVINRNDGTNGRGVVFAQGPNGGIPKHNMFFDLQTGKAGVYALYGEQNFAVIDTANAADVFAPVVAPGAQFTYLNEVMLNNLVGTGFTAIDAAEGAAAAFASAGQLVNWRQNYSKTVTGQLAQNSYSITGIDPGTRGIIAGMFVTDNTAAGNLQPGTRVVSVDSVDSLTINLAARETGTDSLTFSSHAVVITTGTVTDRSNIVQVDSAEGIVASDIPNQRYVYAADLSNPNYIASGNYVVDVNYGAKTVTLVSNCTVPIGSSTDTLTFTNATAAYPWPDLLTYAGNFVSPHNMQLALADLNGNLWTQQINDDGSLSINSKSVLSGNNPVLKAQQFAVTGDAPQSPSSPGVTGQIVVSGNYIYWYTGSGWVRASGSTWSGP